MCSSERIIIDCIKTLEDEIASSSSIEFKLSTQKRRFLVMKSKLCHREVQSHILAFAKAINENDSFAMNHLLSKTIHKHIQEYLQTLVFTTNFLTDPSKLHTMKHLIGLLQEKLQWTIFMRNDNETLEHELLQLLQRKFNIASFRGNQLPALKAIITGKDVLCFMPTGMGKSLLYQLPGKQLLTLHHKR